MLDMFNGTSIVSSCATHTHGIHLWYIYLLISRKIHIYLHVFEFYGKLVGKYTNPMDPMG